MPTTWHFSSAPLSSIKSRVLAFNGEDRLMHGYSFDILLLAEGVEAKDAPDLLKNLLQAPAMTLTGKRAQNDTFTRHGVAASVSYLFSEGRGSVFRVAFVPRAARLALAVHSRIFLNMQLPQILNKVLKEEKLTPDNDFDNCLKGKYATRPYTCQYNESPANFLRRHLERAGAYSYIRQTDKGDVLVLADESMQAEKLPIRDELSWSEDHADETVFALARTLCATPTRMTVRDYSTEQPGTTAKSLDDAQALYGGGEVNLYAAHNLYGDVDWASKDLIVEEANASAARLAEAGIRALKARSSKAEGESSIPWLQAGYAVTIDKESFQLVSVRHACTPAADELEERMVRRARQAGFITGTAQGYRNAFVCHPLSLCAFAPQCETPRPSIAGLVHVKVDASSDGVYAELDGHGRYKVMFFFPEKVIHTDADDPSEGNRSIPLRMAQSHVGQSSGIHFPLLKGAEALVAFTDGDPDRPVILSAMPNPEHPSVVADKNQESNMIQTPGGHKINLTDTDGKRSFAMETPGGHSIRMHDENGKREIRLEATGGCYIRLHEK